MFEQNNGVILLGTLSDTLADSVKGYRDAAEHVDSTEYRQMFSQLADERSQALSKLQSEVSRLGGSTDGDGSTLGKLHQSWLDFKASITGRDDKAVINEVERGEDYLKAKFEAALKNDDVDPSLRTTIEQVYQSVRQGHDRVSALKHSLEGEPAASTQG